MTSELSRERAEKLGQLSGWLCGIAVILLMTVRPWGSVRSTSFDASTLAFGTVPIEVKSEVEFFAIRTRVGFMLADDHPLRASARSGDSIDAWLLPLCEQVEVKPAFGREDDGGLKRVHLRAAILDGARTRNALGGEFAETNWRGMWIVSFWIAGLIALRLVMDKVLRRWPSLIDRVPEFRWW